MGDTIIMCRVGVSYRAPDCNHLDVVGGAIAPPYIKNDILMIGS